MNEEINTALVLLSVVIPFSWGVAWIGLQGAKWLDRWDGGK